MGMSPRGLEPPCRRQVRTSKGNAYVLASAQTLREWYNVILDFRFDDWLTYKVLVVQAITSPIKPIDKPTY